MQTHNTLPVQRSSHRCTLSILHKLFGNQILIVLNLDKDTSYD